MKCFKEDDLQADDFCLKIGSFDLLKGLGMLSIIIYHTFTFDGIDSIPNNTVLGGLILVVFIMDNALMPMFFVVFGYGLRRIDTATKLKKMLLMYIEPYAITAILTVGIHFILHYVSFGYLKGAAIETLKVFLGLLLGLPINAEIFGFSIFWGGAIWFLASLHIAFILLFLITKLPKKLEPLAVLFLACAGWYLGCNFCPIFCIPQGMIATAFIWAGQQVHRHKFLTCKWQIWQIVCFILAIIVSASGILLKSKIDNIAGGAWVFGPVSVLTDGIIAIGLLYFFVRLGNGEGIISDKIKSVGQTSLFVLCVHSIELIAIPWYLVREWLMLSVWMEDVIILILRSLVILFGVWIAKKLFRVNRKENKKYRMQN